VICEQDSIVSIIISSRILRITAFLIIIASEYDILIVDIPYFKKVSLYELVKFCNINWPTQYLMLSSLKILAEIGLFG
jgi:hypothetical protein